MVRFSIRKKVLESSSSSLSNGSRNDRETTETTGGNDGNDEGEMTEMTGKPQTGLWLKIRLEMLSSVVSWFPPHGVMGNDREMTETTGGNDGNDGGNDGETTDWFVA